VAERKFVAERDLTEVVNAAFGSGRRLGTLTRLTGGSKKGVYRLTLDDESSAVLYVWHADENYWPATAGEASAGSAADPFSDASGAELFDASSKRLTALGVRTPRVQLMDRSHTLYPADFAVVEDVRGSTLEALLTADPPRARQALAELAGMLEVMHRQRSPVLGKVALVDGGGGSPDLRCEGVVRDRALDHVAQAARRLPRIADVQGRLAEMVSRLAAQVGPRAEHGLIHGELGPDHVLVDELGHPVIIDIEGAMFFDVEWEHAFLELRFHQDYRALRAADLDEDRLRLYRLALHLSLVAGPLRLIDGDFPDPDFMRAIIDWNAEQALAFLD
jgi:hypothetical protein